MDVDLHASHFHLTALCLVSSCFPSPLGCEHCLTHVAGENSLGCLLAVTRQVLGCLVSPQVANIVKPDSTHVTHICGIHVLDQSMLHEAPLGCELCITQVTEESYSRLQVVSENHT